MLIHARSAEAFGLRADYQSVLDAYQAAVNELESSPHSEEQLARAYLGLGQCLVLLGNAQAAITAYRRVIEIEGPLRNEQRTGSNTAQWGIAEALFAQGEYSAARDALTIAEKRFPVRTICGNAIMAQWGRYAASLGVLNEYLGFYRDAVEFYLLSGEPQIHMRLIRLYEHTGHLEDLGNIVRQHEVWYASIQKDQKNLRRSDLGRAFDRSLETYRLAKAGQWRTLLEAVDPSGSRSPGFPQVNVLEAARILAENQAETLPYLLKGSAEPTPGRQRQFAWYRMYALGLTGAAEAISALKAEALRAKNFYYRQDLVFALSLSGEKGEEAIQELAITGDEELRQVIQKTQGPSRPDRGYGGESVFPFPDLPEDVSLPVSCEHSGEGHRINCRMRPDDAGAPH